MRYMLDTNICIYIIKHKPEKVFKELQKHDPSEVCISSVTYAELIHGVEKSAAIEKNRLALALLLANIEIMNFDVNAAMIAGHAQSLSYTVVTNNVKEFSRVTNLDIVNWAE